MKLIQLAAIFIALFACQAEQREEESSKVPPTMERSVTPVLVRTGAMVLLEEHLDLLQGKKLALVSNHTSLVGKKHLVDTLRSLGMNVVKVFAPEHGFRGDADAGKRVLSSTDPQTGIPIVSLYGASKKPSLEQLNSVDLVLFDIQDVGSRHYTYPGTMTYVMEACADAGKPFVVLDRPNPNGWYVEGPLMQDAYRSFIGMHKVPIVHGMTLGEYAQMVNEEGWLPKGKKVQLQVIPCKGYRHSFRWEQMGFEWVPPSPNLATEYAAYLYPLTCMMEPTQVTEARGTLESFEQVGAPWLDNRELGKDSAGIQSLYGLTFQPVEFTPRSLPGRASSPKYLDMPCKGIRFTNRVEGKALFLAFIALLDKTYEQAKSKGKAATFFNDNFERWSGTPALKKQIQGDIGPEEIWASWQADLVTFKAQRKKYLLYPDFE